MKLKSRLMCAFLSAALLVFLPVACVSNDESSYVPPSQGSPFSTWYDIPGLTSEEIAAVEAILDTKDAFFYGMTLSTEAFSGVDGAVGGYSVLLCEWLGELFGRPFNPVLHGWGDLINGLNDGSIDFSGELTPTEERRLVYHMTEPIAERTVAYFRLEDARPLEEIKETRPVRYAFLEGSITENSIVPLLGEADSYELVYVSSFREAYAAMANGEVDAYINEETVRASFDEYGNVVMRYFFPPVFSHVSMTTKSDALKPIIDVMDKAIMNGGSAYMDEMYNRGYDEYLRHILLRALTEEEWDFILNNPTIFYVSQYNNYPMSFFNENENEWQGIAFDILNEVAYLTGLDFKLAHGDEFIRWPDLLAMVESGEAAFVTELLRTEARIGHYLFLDTTLTSEYLTLVSEEKMRPLRLNEVKNYRVGVIRNTGQTQSFYQWFPDHERIVEYDDTTEALMGMRAGECDLVMSSTANLFVQTNYLELTGFKANIVFTDTLQEGTFGLNIDEEILRSIIDKALEFVDIQAIRDTWRNRTFDYRYQLLEAQRPYLIAFAAAATIILILVIILWLRSRGSGKRLEKLVGERTLTLEQQQQELEELMEAAEAANRAKSDFLATMSHEIRTPMNSIMGFSELAQEADTLPQIKDYMVKIMDSTEWLLRIINDILDISKIEAGKMQMENEPFNLHDILARCQSVILPIVREKGLDLQVYAEPIAGRKLVGDSVRLYQVLINLLSNAVKFTDAGIIRFSALPTQCNNTNVAVRFEVKDEGIGMSSEQIERIFEPFIQADQSTTRTHGGTGLGLAIVKNIVELMGGELAVVSQPGKGATFSFEITFETVESQDGGKEHTNFTRLVKPFFDGLILVCDDNPLNQDVICEHLARVGLRTQVAENGKIGLDLIEERINNGLEPYDLIFMDMFMPVMDGIEAAGKIIALDIGTPIVAMTANLISGEVEKYVRHGMPDCLGKPFTSQELWEILLKYLEPINTEPLTNNMASSDLARTLRLNFVKHNQDMAAQIEEAHAMGDKKLAHRLAHTLKGNAGLIGKSELKNAALEVESLLKDDAITIWEVKMKALKYELSMVLKELSPLLDEEDATDKIVLDKEQTLALFQKLSGMLERINPECVLLLDEIRAVEGAGELAQQIEDYDFTSAAKTLGQLKKKWMEDHA